MRPLESDLELSIIALVNEVKNQYPEWKDPDRLAERLGLKVHLIKMTGNVQGVALEDSIILDSSSQVRGRQIFTFYHEIVHKLIRRNDALYSLLDDKYPNDDDLRQVTERLANIGAGEFLLPRSSIMEASSKYGYSLHLLQHFRGSTWVTPTAVCVQLALCAPHRCIGLVARQVNPVSKVAQSSLSHSSTKELVVEVAVSSRLMKYSVGRNATIQKGHLIHRATEATQGEILTGRARIPFRTSTVWEADCEAMRIGGQIFSLFHVV